MIFNHKQISSPVGLLHLVSNGSALTAVVFDSGWKNFVNAEHLAVTDKSDEVIQETEKQLREYFAGKRTTFDIPLHFNGTEFQQQAWQELRNIPYGRTLSYSDQATNIKKPSAVRAVGAANGKNKICIIIPCHRVIGKNGSLTGFAGGMEAKKFLLQFETQASTV